MIGIRSLKPIRPRNAARLSSIGSKLLKDAFDNAEAGRKRRAAKSFNELAVMFEMSGSPEDLSDAAAMRANATTLLAQIELRRNVQRADDLLEDSIQYLSKALEYDNYWADYLTLKDELYHAQHEEIGCKIVRQPNGKWHAHCPAVSKALNIPGLSRGEKFDLECSICRKDPMFCPHIPGQVYDGRLALQVIRNLEFTEVSILVHQIPEDPNMVILPRDLNDADIRRFFNEGRARQILLNGEMRCIELIRAIRRNGLKGTDFVSKVSK